jgi:putative phage-type endonuclease
MEKEKWLNERRKGIGGSDVAAIIGVSPYRTPLQVWEDKRGLSPAIPDNDAMFWGRTLEPVIRQRYSDVTGRDVLLPTEILRHPKFDFMLGNIDGFTLDNRGVEIKTAGYPAGWGEPGTDEIPIGYIFQILHYTEITGIPVFDVPVLIGGSDFRIYEVKEDKELQERLIEREADFWELVQSGTPPAPINYQDVIRLYRQSEAKAVTATEAVEESIEMLRKVRSDIKTLEANEEHLKKQIMESMAEADTLINLKGDVLATWKQSKEVVRFNLEFFKTAHKDIYDKYLQTSEGTRKFLLKVKKEEK